MKKRGLILAAVLATASLSAVFAAPSRQLVDVRGTAPYSAWFRDFQSSLPIRLNTEFYDNTSNGSAPCPNWGSGVNGWNAIRGVANNIIYDSFGNISDFSITAIIRNDSYAYFGPLTGTEASNAIGQTAYAINNQRCQTLYNVHLTGDFADDGILWNSPGVQSNICAVNYDELGWYGACIEEPPTVNNSAVGNYCVPTWIFGNISAGQQVSRELQFTLFRHEPPGSPLFNLLETSRDLGIDLFANRSSNLGIGLYPGSLFQDDGSANPGPSQELAGSVSVFFEEKAALSVALGANSPADRTWYPAMGTGPVEMLHFRVMSPSTYNVSLGEIAFQGGGSGNDASGVTEVQLWLDINKNGAIDSEDHLSASGYYSSDNGVCTINNLTSPDGYPYLMMYPRSSLDFIITYTIGQDTPSGQSFYLDLSSISAVELLDQGNYRSIEVSGLPIRGCTTTVVDDPPHLDAIRSPKTPERSSWWPARVNEMSEMIYITAQADSNEDLIISSFTMQAYDSGKSAANVAGVEVWNDNNSNGIIDSDDVLFGRGVYSADNGQCTVTSSQRCVIPAGMSKSFWVVYRMSPNVPVPSRTTYDMRVTGIDTHLAGSGDDVIVTGLSSLYSGCLFVMDDAPQMTVRQMSDTDNSVEWWQSMGGVPVVVARLQVDGDPDAPQELCNRHLKATGTGNELTDISEVEIWHDANENGLIDINFDRKIATSKFTNLDRGCPFDMRNTPFHINPGTSPKLLVVFKMVPSAQVGSTYCFFVQSASGLTGELDAPSAVTVVPGTGGALTVVGPPNSLAVSKGAHSPEDKAWYHDTGIELIEMLQFTARTDADYDIKIRSATVSADSVAGVTSYEVWKDSDSDGIVDAGDILLGTADTNDYNTTTHIPFTTVSSVTIPARSTSSFIIAFRMLGTGVVGNCSFKLSGIDAQNADMNLTIPVYGLPIQSCKLAITERPERITAAQARRKSAGTWVMLQNVAVTANFGSSFSVEDTDRAGGIKVRAGTNFVVGDRVAVIGQVWNSEDAMISAAYIKLLPKGQPLAPINMSNRAAGGFEPNCPPLVDYYSANGSIMSSGLSSFGLLIKTTGRVTYVDPMGFFYIDDGSGLWDGFVDDRGDPVKGIRVSSPFHIEPPEPGSIVAVTGIMQHAAYSPDYSIRCLIFRDENDIQLLYSLY